MVVRPWDGIRRLGRARSDHRTKRKSDFVCYPNGTDSPLADLAIPSVQFPARLLRGHWTVAADTTERDGVLIAQRSLTALTHPILVQ